MKPIHKFNNGRGATLCHSCSVIISEGMTKDLYCEKCRPKQETTLEEAAEKYVKDSSHELYELRKQCFLDGYKLAQERSYSEEEVKKLIVDFLFVKGIGKEVGSVNEWFKQFKKK